MGIEFDVEVDEGEIREAVVEQMKEGVKEYLETEAQKGVFECVDCGGDSFDIEVWETAGEIRGAGVCRGCNTRRPLDVDMSDFDELR